MNIYLIWQEVNNDWDTYDSAVVVANSEHEAINIHPNGRAVYGDDQFTIYDWCRVGFVKVKFIGTCSDTESKVILSSFNAG